MTSRRVADPNDVHHRSRYGETRSSRHPTSRSFVLAALRALHPDARTPPPASTANSAPKLRFDAPKDKPNRPRASYLTSRSTPLPALACLCEGVGADWPGLVAVFREPPTRVPEAGVGVEAVPGRELCRIDLKHGAESPKRAATCDRLVEPLPRGRHRRWL